MSNRMVTLRTAPAARSLLISQIFPIIDPQWASRLLGKCTFPDRRDSAYHALTMLTCSGLAWPGRAVERNQSNALPTFHTQSPEVGRLPARGCPKQPTSLALPWKALCAIIQPQRNERNDSTIYIHWVPRGP